MQSATVEVRDEIAQIAATGPITGVVVHGRGAVITRRIDVSDPLPDGTLELLVEGITPLADPGSVRVRLPQESRPLVNVNARLVIPHVDDGPGESVEKVEAITRQIDRASDRIEQLRHRRERLRSFRPAPLGRRDVETHGPEARVDSAMGLAEIVKETLRSVDERLLSLEREVQKLERDRDSAALEDMQTSSGDRMGPSHPTRTFEIRLGDGSGSSLDGAELSYVVPYAAKWWPLYSLRLTEGGTAATLTMEALVAQRTGEDWTGVPIGLSTSEIVFDATLPRLPSLRLGKRQPSQRRGFREPPAGTERLFQGYDTFMGRLEPKGGARSSMPTPKPPPSAAPMTLREEAVDYAMSADMPAEEQVSWEEVSDGGRTREETGDYRIIQRQQASAPRKARKKTAPSAVGGMPHSAMSMAAPGAPPAASSGFGGGGAYGGEVVTEAPDQHDPGNDWLRFDSLVLAGRDSPHRGSLRVRKESAEGVFSELYDAQESAKRMSLVDPAVSRGMFDYRYDSDGTVRIPADGKLHRVSISEKDADSQLEWRAVPAENPAVYREAKLSNPFDSPLLAGPVDVYSEGQLVTTTSIERIDAGGSMRVGLGIDERIRVARNVRMQEESAGLLGGKRELIHDVEIDLRSGLGFEAQVEVLDRIPVTSDDHVDVDLISAQPDAMKYDQSSEGAPIEGGRRWLVQLAAGGRSKVKFRYQITLRSKDEIVGGNRRD